MVAGLFVVLAFSSGLGFYNQAVLIRTLPAHTGLAVSDLSNATTLFFLASGFAGLLIAKLLEQSDVRLIMGVGAVVSAVALALIGHVRELWQLYLVYLLFGVGFSSSGLIPSTTLITRWFVNRRASALAVASTGLSAGGVVITPMCAALVDVVPIETATGLMGLAYLLGVLPCLLLLRSRPPVPASQPGAPAGITPELPGTPFEVAIRSRYFWCLSGAYLLLMASQVGGIAHQYGLVDERGSGGNAALALAVLPLFSIFGRLAGGFIADRHGVRGLTIIMVSLQTVAMVMLAFAHSWIFLLVSLAVFGMSVGNLLMLHPLLVADAFGPRHYPRLFSMSNLTSTFGVALGPALMGIAFEWEGAYGFAFGAAAASSLAATVLFLAGGKPVLVREPETSAAV